MTTAASIIFSININIFSLLLVLPSQITWMTSDAERLKHIAIWFNYFRRDWLRHPQIRPVVKLQGCYQPYPLSLYELQTCPRSYDAGIISYYVLLSGNALLIVRNVRWHAFTLRVINTDKQTKAKPFRRLSAEIVAISRTSRCCIKTLHCSF